MKTNESRLVVPGESILNCSADIRPGKGCYELHNNIRSSLAGYVFVKEEVVKDKIVKVVEVRRREEQQDHVIPYIGGIVTARVLNIGSKFAKCQLICVEDSPLTSEYSAILRKEDIRQQNRDEVNLSKCVQPEDVIVARVISFGDNQTSFILSVAEEQLGVVSAFSEDGERMICKDFDTMQGVKTGCLEPRKVAKIPDLNSRN